MNRFRVIWNLILLTLFSAGVSFITIHSIDSYSKSYSSVSIKENQSLSVRSVANSTYHRIVVIGSKKGPGVHENLRHKMRTRIQVRTTDREMIHGAVAVYFVAASAPVPGFYQSSSKINAPTFSFSLRGPPALLIA